MSAAVASITCPPEEVVLALHEGHLDESAATELRAHIDVCSTCLATMAAIASGSRAPLDPTLPVSPAEPWSPPERIDGFHLAGPLGSGGMGRVFLAHDTALDRPVAIKLLAAARPDGTALARFLIEARAIARLSHPNVVAIYRIGEVEGRPYLAYEYVNGPSLDRVAKPMPWAEALGIALGLARGLAAAHQRDVLHRDIKPANAILSADGDVKLLDFGLAKLAEDAPAQSASPASVLHLLRSSPDLTATGALLGTPLYMAPELWAGQPATPRSDLFSLGLILHELCTGVRPRENLPLVELARRAQAEDVPPVRATCPAMPEAFAQVIDRCVARAPEDRFASAAEVRDALEAVDSFLRAFRPSRAARAEPGDPYQGVGDSFARVAPRADDLVAGVYTRMFAARPDLRAMFPADMSEQRMKLGSALRLAIDNLRVPAVLEPMLEDLGRRHAAKGVRPEHFDALGTALVASLAELDWADWSTELSTAWWRAYDRVAQAMIRGLRAAESDTLDRTPEAGTPPDTSPPETRFTTSGDAVIAYQIVGQGPIDVIVVPAWVTHVEAAWASPRYDRFVRGLAASARVIAYDQRGAGLSERSRPPTSNDERVEDLLAVLDAAGSQRAVILGASTAAGLALLFAERHPERTRGLAILGGSPGTTSVRELGEAFEERLRAGWGSALFFDLIAPSAALDEPFRKWWATYLRTGSSPSMALALRRIEAETGYGDALASIETPTLVVHRTGDRVSPIAESRALASSIPGARHVDLPGEDHLVLAGDVAAVIEEVRRFLDDLRGAAASGVTTTLHSE